VCRDDGGSSSSDTEGSRAPTPSQGRYDQSRDYSPIPTPGGDGRATASMSCNLSQPVIDTSKLLMRFASDCHAINVYGEGDWGTAYRDFMQCVRMCKIAGECEMTPNHVSHMFTNRWVDAIGGGQVRVHLWKLVGALGFMVGMWRNKFTMYWRVHEFLGFCDQRGGEFEDTEMGKRIRNRRAALREWVKVQDVLPNQHWSTKLKREMLRDELDKMMGRSELLIFRAVYSD
jgi:hypothetical protein